MHDELAAEFAAQGDVMDIVFIIGMICENHRTPAGSVYVLCQKECREFRMTVDYVGRPLYERVEIGFVHRMLYPDIGIDLLRIETSYVYDVSAHMRGYGIGKSEDACFMSGRLNVFLECHY